jgi:hypothetical protein
VQTDAPLPSFWTVVEAARRRNEVAIGYRVLAAAKEPSKSFGVVINPDKSLPCPCRRAQGDRRGGELTGIAEKELSVGGGRESLDRRRSSSSDQAA